MSSCSTFPLHNFFRILLLMELLFFFFGADRPCIIMQNHKTSNNLISDPLDKDFITKMQIHPLIQFGFFCKKKKRVLQSTGEKNLYTFKCYSCYRINLIHVNLSEFFILTVNKNKDNPQQFQFLSAGLLYIIQRGDN